MVHAREKGEGGEGGGGFDLELAAQVRAEETLLVDDGAASVAVHAQNVTKMK